MRFYERLGFEATHEGMKLYLGLSSPDVEEGFLISSRVPGESPEWNCC